MQNIELAYQLIFIWAFIVALSSWLVFSCMFGYLYDKTKKLEKIIKQLNQKQLEQELRHPNPTNNKNDDTR